MKATVKLTYDPNTLHLHWGVALWISRESRWIEQARFVFSWDALSVREHFEHGYIARPPHKANMAYFKMEQTNA